MSGLIWFLIGFVGGGIVWVFLLSAVQIRRINDYRRIIRRQQDLLEEAENVNRKRDSK